jgi:hypothetical protein
MYRQYRAIYVFLKCVTNSCFYDRLRIVAPLRGQLQPSQHKLARALIRFGAKVKEINLAICA